MPTTTTRLSHAERRARRKAIAEYVKGGRTRAEAARHFGVNVKTVQVACQEYDVECHQVPRKATNSLRIVALLLNTAKPVEEIAGEFGVNRTWVYELLREAKEAGIKFPPARTNMKLGRPPNSGKKVPKKSA